MKEKPNERKKVELVFVLKKKRLIVREGDERDDFKEIALLDVFSESMENRAGQCGRESALRCARAKVFFVSIICILFYCALLLLTVYRSRLVLLYFALLTPHFYSAYGPRLH